MSIKGVTRLSKCLLGDYGNKEAGTTISGGIIYEDTSNPSAPGSPGEEEKRKNKLLPNIRRKGEQFCVQNFIFGSIF